MLVDVLQDVTCAATVAQLVDDSGEAVKVVTMVTVEVAVVLSVVVSVVVLGESDPVA
jgi:hypothetical protein